MCRVANAPNPVETPYTGVGSLASASIVSRLAWMAAAASSESTTRASSRATATTSPKPTGPIPTVTVMCGQSSGSGVERRGAPQATVVSTAPGSETIGHPISVRHAS